jgi:hypothetical protein
LAFPFTEESSAEEVIPSLPELILQAVTESAAIKQLHVSGAVLWSGDALERLSSALARKFVQASKNRKLRNQLLAMLLSGLNKEIDFEDELVPEVILFILLAGTGVEFEE